MPNQGRYQGRQRTVRRNPTTEGAQEHATRTQRWKEGAPEEWQAMLRDAECDGDLVRRSESLESAILDDLDEGAMDGEIDLGDEDDIPIGGIEGHDNLEGADFLMGGSDAGILGTSTDRVFRIVVNHGLCRLETPRWLVGRPTHDEGYGIMDEPYQRLDTLQRLVKWLNENRKQFLLDPDPWYLGIDALEELRRGKPSVTEDGFLRLLELSGITINREKRHAAMSWEDGSLPLDFLFSSQAKQAWAANALLQRYSSDPIRIEDLARTTHLTSPKDGKTAKAIKNATLNGLDFENFIRRVCLEAGTAWNGVLPVLHSRLSNS